MISKRAENDNSQVMLLWVISPPGASRLIIYLLHHMVRHNKITSADTPLYEGGPLMTGMT